MVYKEKRDIKLVADALGHRSIITTQDYYAKLDDEGKKLAFKAVRLRDKKKTDGSEPEFRK